MHFDDIIIEIINKFMIGEKVDIEHYLNQYPEYREMILDKLRTLNFIKKGFEEQELKDKELGEYIILQELGRGGMGTVFLAIQPSLSRLIALKVLPPNFTYYKEALKNFQEEAKTIAKFNHPNIIPVYSTGTEKGVNYIAMAYIPGLSLNNLAEKVKEFKNLENLKASDIENIIKPATIDKKAITEKTITLKRNPIFLKQNYYRLIASLFAEISEAVSYAHQNGIIHGDLKPSNILLTYELMPTVTDFGLSKDIKKLTSSKSKEFTGTLVYAAPEQIKDNTINEKTDIWSLGVALYELLTLKSPFLDKSIEKIAYNIINLDPLPLKSINRRIPIELEAITLKCLEKNPEKRYNSALELSQDLRNYLELKPIKAKPIGTIGRVCKWAKRRPILAMLMIILSLTILSGSYGFYSLSISRLVDRGVELQTQSKSEEAEKLYNKALRMSGKNFLTKSASERALIGLAGIYINEPIKAFEYYKKCADINPNNIAALHNMACLYEDLLGKDDEAEKCYKHILKINPTYSIGIDSYGRLLHKLGRTDEAIKCYTNYLKSKPDDLFVIGYYLHFLEVELKKQPDELLRILAEMCKIKKVVDNESIKFHIAFALYDLIYASRKTVLPIDSYDKAKAVLISKGFEEEYAKQIIDNSNLLQALQLRK